MMDIQYIESFEISEVESDNISDKAFLINPVLSECCLTRMVRTMTVVLGASHRVTCEEVRG